MATIIKMSDGELVALDHSRGQLVAEIGDALNMQTGMMGDPERAIPKGFLYVRDKNGQEIVIVRFRPVETR